MRKAWQSGSIASDRTDITEQRDKETLLGTVHFNLQDQVAVVTGASQGIGAACAERLSADGAAVALWDVDDARGQALATRLVDGGARAIYVRCNVASKSEVDAAVGTTPARFGRID